MKTTITVLSVATALLSAGAVSAEEISAEARLAAQQVAVTICASCHGPQGRSIAPKFPALAGQHAGYLAAQLQAFKAQSRGDPDALGYMWGMAAPLSDEMITALAGYYSAQKPGPGSGGDSAAIARGAGIYNNGIAADGIPACTACHGPGAVGTAEYPRLAGQHAQYLLKQVRSFQNNMRNVAVMHGVAQGLKIDEIRDVAAYLQSLGG